MVVLVDARNVLRSQWPNIPEKRLVELCAAWAARNARQVLVVFDGAAPGVGVGTEELDEHTTVVGTGAESADDWLVRHAPGLAPVQLVTSDRELRGRVGDSADTVTGGGRFARELQEAP